MREIMEYNDAVEMWRGFGIRTAGDLDCRLAGFRIHFAYHSAVIENAAVTLKDTRDVF